LCIVEKTRCATPVPIFRIYLEFRSGSSASPIHLRVRRLRQPDLQAGTTPNPYLYRGERYETDLGLYYLRARWYNPATGRFMTHDPYQGSVYDPTSLHRYNYARANPANFIDPSGRLSAGEYATATWELTKKSFVLTAYSFVQNCTIYAIASSVQLVGDNAGFHVDELGTNFRACGATITVSNFGRAWLANFALMGLGYASGALGEWLFPAEQGMPTLVPENEPITRPIGELRSAGLKDAHHVIQDAAVRDLPGYDTNAAPGVQLEGPSTSVGSPHYEATQVQRAAGGGTYADEQTIAYKRSTRSWLFRC
jgi:RHS repeat-associated protein